MKMPMPKKLKKEPLIDTVFELRFTSVLPASSILPGILFNKLSGAKNIEKLPAAQLPEQLRSADPNLRFAPLTRIECGNFVYLISDRSLAVACKMPYPGWTAFKAAILVAMKHLETAKIVSSVNRYGLKYVDLIPSKSMTDKASLVNLSLTVGEHTLRGETFQIRVEIPKKDIINVVQIVSNAEFKPFNATKKEGLIIDIDSIVNVKDLDMKNILKGLSKSLSILHDINVKLFFDCLKPETIAALEPIYE